MIDVGDPCELKSGTWNALVIDPDLKTIEVQLTLRAENGLIEGEFRLTGGNSPWSDTNHGTLHGRYWANSQLYIELKSERGATFAGNFGSAAPRAEQFIAGIVTTVGKSRDRRQAGVLGGYLQPKLEVGTVWNN